MSRLPEVLPDSLLVQRMAALSDRTALAELDARHGMTLYALAYALLFDGEAADVAVAMALREAWRSAAAFDVRAGSVVQWLAALTRRAAVQWWPVAKLACGGDGSVIVTLHSVPKNAAHSQSLLGAAAESS